MKKIKYIVLLICLVSFHYSFGQHLSKCGILNEILEDTTARQIFKFYRNPDPVAIFDTSGFFESCDVGRIAGKDMKIVNDTTQVSRANYYRVLVYVELKRRSRYLIQLYAERTHGLGSAEIKEKKGKFYITSKRYGIID